MAFIIENWQIILVFAIFVCGGTISVIKFFSMSKTERYNQIMGWLLQAVILAEREFGSGTGKLKLSSVYDKFCERMPWLAKTISFDTFSGYVDNALEQMKATVSTNAAIASICEKGE